jgi:hypothetical protein
MKRQSRYNQRPVSVSSNDRFVHMAVILRAVLGLSLTTLNSDVPMIGGRC